MHSSTSTTISPEPEKNTLNIYITVTAAPTLKATRQNSPKKGEKKVVCCWWFGIIHDTFMHDPLCLINKARSNQRGAVAGRLHMVTFIVRSRVAEVC